jgi:hypothetical protein
MVYIILFFPGEKLFISLFYCGEHFDYYVMPSGTPDVFQGVAELTVTPFLFISACDRQLIVSLAAIKVISAGQQSLRKK